MTFTRANGYQGAMRASLTREATQAAGDADAITIALRVLVYPDIAAACSGADGMAYPVTFDEFLQLPDEYIDACMAVVHELNPHWKRQFDARVNPEQEKKTEN